MLLITHKWFSTYDKRQPQKLEENDIIDMVISKCKQLKGRVWYKYKYILKDGRTYPETAAIFFFYEKFVILVRQQLRPALIFSVIPSHLFILTHHTQQGVAGAVHSVGGGFRE